MPGDRILPRSCFHVPPSSRLRLGARPFDGTYLTSSTCWAATPVTYFGSGANCRAMVIALSERDGVVRGAREHLCGRLTDDT